MDFMRPMKLPGLLKSFDSSMNLEKEGMTATEEEINEFCSALPRYKRPRKIIFADEPRNATGKIEKPKLRRIYCGERLVEAESTS